MFLAHERGSVGAHGNLFPSHLFRPHPRFSSSSPPPLNRKSETEERRLPHRRIDCVHPHQVVGAHQGLFWWRIGGRVRRLCRCCRLFRFPPTCSIAPKHPSSPRSFAISYLSVDRACPTTRWQRSRMRCASWSRWTSPRPPCSTASARAFSASPPAVPRSTSSLAVALRLDPSPRCVALRLRMRVFARGWAGRPRDL